MESELTLRPAEAHADDGVTAQSSLDLANGFESLSPDRPATVEIALLPTRFGWEAPEFLSWGGWNYVPFPNDHVALMRHWSEVYGAEVVAMTDDVVVTSVSAPPSDEPAAIELTREHFLYAPDSGWQRTGAVVNITIVFSESS